jgi:hypothetical protein
MNSLASSWKEVKTVKITISNALPAVLITKPA